MDFRIVSASPAGRSQRWTRTLFAAVPLAITAGAALLHLPFPFFGDQAFTLAGAQAVDRGQTFYKDFWDVRQPGATYFYWVAGRVFGFSEFGVHALELLWMALAAVVLAVVARESLSRKWLATAAPLLTVGFYYLQASYWELTQTEALLLLPLGLCLWCVLPRPESPRRQALSWFAFGCASAVVAMFKLVVLIVPLTLAAIRIGTMCLQQKPRIGRLVSSVILPGAAGFCACLLPLIIHFWLRNALGIVYWTTFSYPRLALHEIPRAPRWRLASDVVWFGTPWLAGLPFLLLALRRNFKAAQPTYVWLLCGWMGAALGSIVVQSFTWWRYLFLLLVGPVGLLAVRGVDLALDALKITPSRERLVAAIMVAPLVVSMAWPMRAPLAAAFTALQSPSVGDAFRASISQAYPQVLRSARLIRANQKPGSIFVFGDQRILFFAGRPQAIPLRGAATRSLLQEQWDTLPGLFTQSPPTFIYFSQEDLPYVLSRSPGMSDLLRMSYRVLTVDDMGGTWYERTSTAGPLNPRTPGSPSSTAHDST